MRGVVLLAGAGLVLADCRKSPTRPSDTGASIVAAVRATDGGSLEVAELIYDGALKSDWEDLGWSRRELKGPGPARVDFSNLGGWMIGKTVVPNERADLGGLTFRVKAPLGDPDFLEVRADITDGSTFPRVKIGPQHRRDAGDGWSEVTVPMSELNPEGLPFDRLILRAFRSVPSGWTELDKVGLLAPTSEFPGSESHGGMASRRVPLTVNCRAVATRIDPRIYGIGYDAPRGANDSLAWSFGATARRWGGNTMTRYNWELGNAWNTASDWYFENVPVGSYKDFLAADAEHHVKSALTVPTAGWVAKDATSSAFPVSVFGPQQATDPGRRGAGNGKGPDGRPLSPKSPAMTSVPAPPEFVRAWVQAIRQADAETGTRSVDQYILDNEPSLWNSTHRDIHPEPLTYDELLDRTIAYGTAIRDADPDAVIAGPAAWGWPEYFFSAKDMAVGTGLRPDRRSHGDMPLLAWWLQKLRQHEQKTGKHIIDLVDVHFYPQSVHVFDDKDEDAKAAALRLRSTRSLWDPTYKDESWIDDTIMLLPRLQNWIADNYPGRGISIGEYNFGGENHVSGALAEAEVLGRFAEHRVSSAFFWTYPKAGSPILEAFRAYRDFDGKGGHFLDYFVPATAPPAGTPASIFVSRDTAGTHFVIVLLDLSGDTAVRASVNLDGCGPVQSRSAYIYAGGSSGFAAVKQPPTKGTVLDEFLAPYSIMVVDINLQTPAPGALEK